MVFGWCASTPGIPSLLLFSFYFKYLSLHWFAEISNEIARLRVPLGSVSDKYSFIYDGGVVLFFNCMGKHGDKTLFDWLITNN